MVGQGGYVYQLWDKVSVANTEHPRNSPWELLFLHLGGVPVGCGDQCDGSETLSEVTAPVQLGQKLAKRLSKGRTRIINTVNWTAGDNILTGSVCSLFEIGRASCRERV